MREWLRLARSSLAAGRRTWDHGKANQIHQVTNTVVIAGATSLNKSDISRFSRTECLPTLPWKPHRDLLSLKLGDQRDCFAVLGHDGRIHDDGGLRLLTDNRYPDGRRP